MSEIAARARCRGVGKNMRLKCLGDVNYEQLFDTSETLSELEASHDIMGRSVASVRDDRASG